MDLLGDFLLVVIGLAGGLAVGSGLVAFITVLDIVPRLTLLTRTLGHVRHYQYAIVTGAVGATWIEFSEYCLSLPFMAYDGSWFIGRLLCGFTCRCVDRSAKRSSHFGQAVTYGFLSSLFVDGNGTW